MASGLSFGYCRLLHHFAYEALNEGSSYSNNDLILVKHRLVTGIVFCVSNILIFEDFHFLVIASFRVFFVISTTMKPYFFSGFIKRK